MAAEFATVASIKGQGIAFAIDPQGTARVLKAGDVLQRGETVRTTGTAQVELLMQDGDVLSVAPQQSVTLDAQVVESPQRPAAQDAAVSQPASIDAILDALERGSDLSEELDPAAAGLAGGSGNDGGHSFVRLLRIMEPVEPLRYDYAYRAPDRLDDIRGAAQPVDDKPEASLALSGAVATDETSDLGVTRSAPVVDVGAVVGDNSSGASINVALVIDNAATGLTTSDGHAILLVPGATDNDVVGMFDSNGDGVLDTAAFDVSITDGGVVSVTQHVALTHPEPATLVEGDTSSYDESVTLDGLVSVVVTVVDGDGDVATATQPIGGSISFADDGPGIDVGLAGDVQMGGLVTQDAETSGAGYDVATSAGSFSSLFTVSANAGADQPGVQSVQYTLSIGAGLADTGLTSHGAAITLVMQGGEIVGQAFAGETTVDVFRISVDGGGTVTLTQYAQIDHLPEDIDAGNDTSVIGLAAGSVSLTATATLTDADQDTVTDAQAVDISAAIAFEDDVPSVTVTAVADAHLVLTTQDADTAGAAADTASVSFAGAFLAAAAPVYGADGAGSTTVSGYTLSLNGGDGADSGLTSNGQAITLTKVGSDVIGSTTAGEVFRISVDAGGTVTLTQSAQIDHLPEDVDATNDTSNLGVAAGLVTLSATATTTDFDNDTATATVSADLGGNISFDDDVPSVTVNAVADGGIVLTTQDAQTIGSAADSASASFAAAFLAAAQPVYGADGAGSTTLSGYTLILNDTASGLTSNGQAITLAKVGSDVIGSTSGGEVFRISVDAGGTVTLTQSAQIDHLPEDADATNDTSNLGLAAGLVTLSATATTTDFDHDTATATVSADLGGNIAFDDDVPSVTANAVVDGNIVLTTQDVDTRGGSIDFASASFAAAFLAAAQPVYGADGAGTTAISGYTLVLNGADSGLTSNGQSITLAKVGADVVGSTTAGEVFRISVNAEGLVTLTQSAQIDHLPEDADATNDTTNLGLAAGLVTLSATATTTDFDNDTATATVSADLGGNIAFDDDVPSVTANAVIDGSIVLTTQDAQTIGDASDTASASFAAAFLAAAAPVYGADGAGSTTISGYTLLLNGTDSGLTSNGQAITLAKVGADVVGSTSAGEVFRISVNAEGLVTLTQSAQIDHLPEDVDATNDTTNLGLVAGLVTLSATATTTDFDNDTATATVSADLGGNIAFDDDVPSVTANAVVDGSIVLTTQDVDTRGGSIDFASASFADAFLAAAAPVYGADGAGSTAISGYTLVLNGADSGLTSNGQAITLAKVGADVVGSTTAGEVFRISVNAEGLLTLSQSAQIDHLPEDADATNDTTNLGLAAGLVTLSATATTTDFDHDTATATVSADLGGNIAFDDDVPSVTANAVADGDIVLTTQDAQTIGTAADSASASFAAAFLAAAQPVYGADGAGGTAISGYTLSLNGGDGVAAGLTSNGQTITLAKVGADVVGSTSAGEVFRISVNAEGLVTLTQSAQIDHLPEDADATNDTSNLGLAAGLVTLSATATTTDFDHDTATATVSADLGGNIAFDDDVPSVTANAVVDGSIVMTTQDVDTRGGSIDFASASFADAFLAAAAPVYGADGAGSTAISDYMLSLNGSDGVASGLTSHGQSITLAKVGADVVGSTTAGEVFRISVSTDGLVTLTQSAQIDHLPEDADATNDTSNLGLAAGLVTLSATATTTDFDNDTATATVSADLGGNIGFDDDVPSVTANAVADGGIVLTTQDADTAGAASDMASASFGAAFLAAAQPVYGADGAGSTTVSGYTLSLNGGDGADSGLTSNGQAITLTKVGANVIGSTTAGEVFRISVDAGGTVTLTQSAQIDHLPEDVDATNDTSNLGLAAGLVTLSATATTTDFDNDTATATVSADLGGNLSFDDDMPSVTAGAVAAGSIVMATQDADTRGGSIDFASASFADAFLAAAQPVYGADGAGTTAISGYALSVNGGDGVDSGLTSNGQAITLARVGADVVGSTTAGEVFRISVNAEGLVTLSQSAQIDHLPEDVDATNDTSSLGLAADLVTLSATATTTDYDNDTATATVSADLGSSVRFDDDVPSLTLSAVADGAIVLTTQDAQTIGSATDTASASFAAAFLAAVTPSIGADAPGTSVVVANYALNLLNGDSGLTSAGLAITLTMDGADVVGRTSVGGVLTDVLRISVDASGTVTLTQYQHIDHLPEDPDGVNDTASVSLATGLVTVSATATVTDFDNDTAIRTVSADLGGNLSFDDDLPSVVEPATAYAVNVTGSAGTVLDVPLDTDSSVDNNYGADAPGSVRFLTPDGSDSGYTSNTQPIYQYVSADGLTLIGSTLAGSTFSDAWADRSLTGAFIVTLDPTSGTANHDFQLLRQIDGGAGSFNTSSGAWDFRGGNTNYAYFLDVSGQGLPNVLVTPSVGTRVNGTANEVGLSGGGGGQNVGEAEAMRVDFVTNVTGDPQGTTYQSSTADHQFDEHVLVNGAAVTFSLPNAGARSTVNFRAFDDQDAVDATPGEDDTVGDYASEATPASEQVTRVIVNGTAYTADYSAAGFSVDFLADGSVTVSGLKDGDNVALFTADGFTTVEYHYTSGSSFALSGFGASAFDPGAMVSLGFDVGVVDSDGDVAVMEDGIVVNLSPDDHVVLTGSADPDTLTAAVGQAATLVGLAGNDILSGERGDDILVGGIGDDVLSGGEGSDTAMYADASAGINANLATGSVSGGDGADVLTSIENLVGSRYGDVLSGDAGMNRLAGGGGNDVLSGEAGADLLMGGSGDDSLSGGLGADLLTGGTGSDIVRGGAGNDILAGGDGGNVPDVQSDTFEWRAGDDGSAATPAADVLRDMKFGRGGDVLDLSDLLQGELGGTGQSAAESLDQYLRFTEVDGKAVLEVDPDAGAFSPTQTITFDDMSLGELTTSLGLPTGASDLDIIRQLLEQGNLRNEP